MWFNRQKMNNGLLSDREYRRLLNGQYQPNVQDVYSPDEYYELIRLYEEENFDRLDKNQKRREQRQKSMMEYRKKNDNS